MGWKNISHYFIFREIKIIILFSNNMEKLHASEIEEEEEVEEEEVDVSTEDAEEEGAEEGEGGDEGGEDEEGGEDDEDDDDDDEEEEEEDEEEPVDPLDTLRERCASSIKCQKAMARFEECESRVKSKSNTEEKCTEEILDFFHCQDYCMAKDLFNQLK